MFDWLSKWFDARRRAMDLKYLLPAIKDQAVLPGTAERAFLTHMQMDPAWSRHYSAEQLRELAKQYANDTN